MAQNAGTNGKVEGRNSHKPRFSCLSDTFSRMKQKALSCWIPKSEGSTNLRKNNDHATAVVMQASNEITNCEKFGDPYRYRSTQFSYDVLRYATNNFDEANFVGKGGSATVYKGTLSDGKKIAVKIYERSIGECFEKSFFDEVEMISRLHHVNLVTLVGYCVTSTKKILVYEWVNNKTLKFHLHGEGRSHMDWQTRRKIAIGCAKGLEYLHNYCTHKEIKPSNILLDDNFEPKIADFGFKNFNEINEHASDGYMDPEYQSTTVPTFQSDIYSFGIVLLELIIGPRDADSSMPHLLIAVKTSLALMRYDKLIDPALAGNYDPRETNDMFKCVIACVFSDSDKRPSISTIARILESPLLALARVEVVRLSHFAFQLEVRALASRVVNATPDEKQQILVENLYPLVKASIPKNLADKIGSEVTNLLLDSDESRILEMTAFPLLLKKHVDRAMNAIKFLPEFREYFASYTSNNDESLNHTLHRIHEEMEKLQSKAT